MDIDRKIILLPSRSFNIKTNRKKKNRRKCLDKNVLGKIKIK